VKFDNLYDLIFDANGDVKNKKKQVLIEGDRLDFLENEGKNLKIQNLRPD
jgi:hypothetical protein